MSDESKRQDPSGNAPDGGNPNTSSGSPAAPERLSRPWLGPLVASVVIAIVLGVMSATGMLVYPRDRVLQRESLPDANQQEAIASLEVRAAELRKMLDAGVCIADGGYVYRDPEAAAAQGLSPEGLEQTMLPALRRGEPPAPDASPGSDGSPDRARSEPGLLGHLDDTVAMVISPEGNDAVSTGSGFFIEPDLLVTNGHVVGSAVGKEVWVVSRALGKLIKAKVEATTGKPEHAGVPDFALVRLADGSHHEKVATLSADVRSLLRVVAAGYPGIINKQDAAYQRMMRGEAGNLPTLSTWKGDVVSVLPGQNGPVVLHSAQIFHGNSGGPLVDLCGRVVGVNTYGLRSGDEATNNALGTSMLADWLRSNGLTPKMADGKCNPEQAEFAQR